MTDVEIPLTIDEASAQKVEEKQAKEEAPAEEPQTEEVPAEETSKDKS